MAFEKKTVVDQITVDAAGHILVRFGLLLLEDGIEIDRKWHRTSIPPGTDPDAQLAEVDRHLALMGKPVCIKCERIAAIKQLVDTVHTPSLVAEYRAEQERQIAAMASPKEAG